VYASDENSVHNNGTPMLLPNGPPGDVGLVRPSSRRGKRRAAAVRPAPERFCYERRLSLCLCCAAAESVRQTTGLPKLALLHDVSSAALPCQSPSPL